MANTNSAFGLRPYRHLSGGCVRMNEYSIASGYSVDIFHGDPVEITGTGKNIQRAAAGNVDSIGVFAGCRFVNAQGEQKFSKHWPANQVATEIVALVYDDPNIVYEIQCDTLAEGDIGQLVDWNLGTGSVATGLSGAFADIGALTASAGKSLRILELKPSVDNAYGTYAKALVSFAEHALKTGTAGAGGA